MTSSFKEKRSCLIFEWKTAAPTIIAQRFTPVFTFMTSKLQLKLIEYHEYYEIYLEGSDRTVELQPFNLSIHLKDAQDPSKSMFHHQYFMERYKGFDCVWDAEIIEILRKVPDFKVHRHLTVICALHAVDELHLPMNDKSVQTTFGAYGSLAESSHPLILDSPLNFESLSQDMGNMLEEHIMPDVQLKTGEHTVSAHKSVLAARSQVFSAMFQHEMVENKSGVIDIKDMDPPVLDAFLKYLYSGKVPDDLPEDVVPKLYAAGDKYAVGALKKVCSDFLSGNIKEDNFLQILVLADAHGDKELKETVTDFVTKHDELLECEIWDSFSEEYPKLANQVYRNYVAKSRSK